MLDHYAFQLKVLENSVCETLRAQCMDESSPFYGALEETAQGVTGPHASISLARRLIEGYCAPGGAFCGREELLDRAALAMEFALTLVHEDGTIDPRPARSSWTRSCNSSSTARRTAPWRAASTRRTTAGFMPRRWRSAGS